MALVVGMVCLGLLSIPGAAMMTVQLTSNQFAQETEAALAKQGAIYGALYRDRFEQLKGPVLGPTPAPDLLEFWTAPLHPVLSRLDVRRDPVLAPVVARLAPDGYTDARHGQILPELTRLAQTAGKSTLAGAIFLDHTGVGLGDSLGDTSLQSYAHLPEVITALSGDVGVALRARKEDYKRHPLTSISRDTGYRVFLAYPVLSQDRVIGAVLLSRTPLNLGKFLFHKRDEMLIVGGFTLLGAALIGGLLLRLMSRPVQRLRNEARAIAAGRPPMADPARHYGMRELADLGESMLSMAETLDHRSQEIATYTDHVTHELKSPVTAILGAAELLEQQDTSPANRATLLGNIRSEGARMDRLLNQLREMTRLRQEMQQGPGQLADMVPEVSGLQIRITQPGDAALPLSNAHGEIILLHMAQNALAHGAQTMWLHNKKGVLEISDDGSGISPKDAPRLTEPFFTTRRDQGGTGMGLAIVSALLERYDARLAVIDSPKGAAFEIRF